MRGIVLAGGKGTRMLPATEVVNKHLIPLVNKPMVLFPIQTLKALGIKEILLITGGGHVGGFANFLGDGSAFGINLTYRVQKEAGGIAQALALGKDFANGEDVVVVLGDNVFDNEELKNLFLGNDEATIFLKEVDDPYRFGVATVENGVLGLIEEKPEKPKSNYAVTGLYKYPNDVFDVITTFKPSARGELEITDVNNFYIKEKRCAHRILRGFWSDAGKPSSFVRTIKWLYEDTYRDAKL